MGESVQKPCVRPTLNASESKDSRDLILGSLDKDDSVKKMMNLALALEDQGHPRRAKETYEEVVKRRKIDNTRDDQVLLFCKTRLSSILRECGLYVEAKKLCQDALDSKIQSTKATRSLRLLNLGELALILRDQGRLEDAYKMIHGTLEKEECNPYQDMLHAHCVIILASISRDLGNYHLSMFLTRKALSAAVVSFGTEHPFALDLALELTQILIALGEFRIADMIALRVFDGFAKRYGADHPRSIKAASYLADIKRLMKCNDDAIDLFERTLEMQKKQLGCDHPDTLSTNCGLAAAYASTTRLRDSKSLLKQVVDQHRDPDEVSLRCYPYEIWARQALDQVCKVQQIVHGYSLMKAEAEEPPQSARPFWDFFAKPIRPSRGQVKLNCRDLALKENRGMQRLATLRANETSVGDISGTALHRACSGGSVNEVRRLLLFGYTRNIQGGIFETPLCAASFAGNLDIVELLVHKGSAPLSKDICGSALQVAMAMDREDLVRTLLQAGADPNIEDNWYGTVLHEASMSGQKHMVELLLDFNANPNSIIMTSMFRTPLEAAAWNGNFSIVQTLLKRGAKVNSQGEGRSALDIAIAGGHENIILELITAGHRAPKTKKESIRSPAREPSDRNTLPSLPVPQERQPTPLKEEPVKSKKHAKKQRTGLIKSAKQISNHPRRLKAMFKFNTLDKSSAR